MASADAFWSREQPGAHFRTPAGTTALADLVTDLLAGLDPGTAVLDVGAGDGALVQALAARHPQNPVTGLDRRVRPPGLQPRVGWRRDTWDVVGATWTEGAGPDWFARLDGPALVLCCEWLDDLPCPVLERAADGWREVWVDPAGRESPGPLAGAEVTAWADRWWPDGERVEAGGSRDVAWADLVVRLRPTGGTALVVDYGHERTGRPTRGTLAAYRRGARVRPHPSPEVNLTAHVAVDAVRAAGEAAGASTRSCRPLSDMVGRSAPGERHPDPLQDLVRRSEYAALARPWIWGGQWWLRQELSPDSTEPGPAPQGETGLGTHT